MKSLGLILESENIMELCGDCRIDVRTHNGVNIYSVDNFCNNCFLHIWKSDFFNELKSKVKDTYSTRTKKTIAKAKYYRAIMNSVEKGSKWKD